MRKTKGGGLMAIEGGIYQRLYLLSRLASDMRARTQPELAAV